jgi:CO dehydrogenase/acetyl-CoA synthase epsilon subunit
MENHTIKIISLVNRFAEKEAIVTVKISESLTNTIQRDVGTYTLVLSKTYTKLDNPQMLADIHTQLEPYLL